MYDNFYKSQSESQEQRTGKSYSDDREKGASIDKPMDDNSRQKHHIVTNINTVKHSADNILTPSRHFIFPATTYREKDVTNPYIKEAFHYYQILLSNSPSVLNSINSSATKNRITSSPYVSNPSHLPGNKLFIDNINAFLKPLIITPNLSPNFSELHQMSNCRPSVQQSANEMNPVENVLQSSEVPRQEPRRKTEQSAHEAKDLPMDLSKSSNKYNHPLNSPKM